MTIVNNILKNILHFLKSFCVKQPIKVYKKMKLNEIKQISTANEHTPCYHV